jgi:hypothetical protein
MCVLYNKCTQPLEARIPCQVAGCRLQVAGACLVWPVQAHGRFGFPFAGDVVGGEMGSSDPSQLHDCCVIRDRSGDTV